MCSTSITPGNRLSFFFLKEGFPKSRVILEEQPKRYDVGGCKYFPYIWDNVRPATKIGVAQ